MSLAAQYMDFRVEVNDLHFDEFVPYGKQLSFIESTQYCAVSYLSAGNGCGKTAVGAYIDVCHWTGCYPEWWEGYRFKKSGTHWVFSTSPSTLIKGIQEQLFCEGGFSKIEQALEEKDSPWPIETHRGGKMPKRFIKSIKKANHYTADNAYIETLEVYHVDGGVSTIWFGHYDLTAKKMAAKHNLLSIHWDEIPPHPMYSEGLARQRTTETGYKQIITATPERGADQLMVSEIFDDKWEAIGNGRTVITIDDVPNNVISEEGKAKAKEITPERDKPAKLYGIPVSGSVFFTKNPADFTISHSEWLNLKNKNAYRVINGLDFGFNDDAAIAQLYIGTDGHIVLAKSMKKRRLKPYQFAEACKKAKFDIDYYPCGWPHDGVRQDKDLAPRRVGADTLKTVAQFHKEAGFKMLPHHNKKFAKEAEKHAIFEHLETMAEQGMFFIVAGNSDFEEEWRNLQIGDDGKVKGKDHALDGCVAAWVARGAAIKVKEKVVLIDVMRQNLGQTNEDPNISSHLYT